jgi:hypothetical protein
LIVVGIVETKSSEIARFNAVSRDGRGLLYREATLAGAPIWRESRVREIGWIHGYFRPRVRLFRFVALRGRLLSIGRLATVPVPGVHGFQSRDWRRSVNRNGKNKPAIGTMSIEFAVVYVLADRLGRRPQG